MVTVEGGVAGEAEGCASGVTEARGIDVAVDVGAAVGTAARSGVLVGEDSGKATGKGVLLLEDSC